MNSEVNYPSFPPSVLHGTVLTSDGSWGSAEHVSRGVRFCREKCDVPVRILFCFHSDNPRHKRQYSPTEKGS